LKLDIIKMEILMVELVFIRFKLQNHPAISKLAWNRLTNS